MTPVVIIQLDIETLSLHPTEALLAEVGMDIKEVCITDGRVQTRTVFNGGYHLDMDEQLADGRSMDLNTVQWWLRQSSPTRLSIGMEQGRVGNRFAAEAISNHINAACYDREAVILASAPDFDFPNLRAWLARYGGGIDLPYYKWHSQRTLRAMCASLPERDTARYPKHGGASDAAWQTDALLHVMEHGQDYERAMLRRFFSLDI